MVMTFVPSRLSAICSLQRLAQVPETVLFDYQGPFAVVALMQARDTGCQAVDQPSAIKRSAAQTRDMRDEVWTSGRGKASFR